MEIEIREKIRVLQQLGIQLTQEQIYGLQSCKNEIQLDNMARRILKMNRR